MTLLMVAIQSDSADFVSLLLRAGADAQLVNPERGYLAPIHVAAQNMAIKSLKLLVPFLAQSAAHSYEQDRFDQYYKGFFAISLYWMGLINFF